MEMRPDVDGSGVVSSCEDGEVRALRDGSELGAGEVISTSSCSIVPWRVVRDFMCELHRQGVVAWR